MKIKPDHILTKQGQLNSKDKNRVQDQEKFQKIMAQKLGEQTGRTQKSKVYAGPDHLASLGGSLQVQMNTPPCPLSTELDALLDKWENYSQNLGSPDIQLKQSYQQLTALSKNISQIKQSHTQELATNPQLKNLINELEVLTITEQIKFNRGDYLP